MTDSAPSPTEQDATGPAAPFGEIADYVALPRVTALTLSADGSRLVAAVSSLNDEGNAFVSALWEVDPGGGGAARRLTRSAEGEGAPAFLPDGSLLFTSKREGGKAPGEKGGSEQEKVPALWLLPAAGGEARRVATRPGGVTGVWTARASATAVVSAPTMAAALDAADDGRLRDERRSAKLGAVLHESMPVRYWDHDLGPDYPRLFAVDDTAAAPEGGGAGRDLTPDAGAALYAEDAVALTPDGSTALTPWQVPLPGGSFRTDLVAIDTASGSRRTVAGGEEWRLHYSRPSVSPDGRQVVCVREVIGIPGETTKVHLWLADVSTGEGRVLAPDADFWPHEAVFSGDGEAVLVCADHHGQRPVFRVDIATGAVTRLTVTGAFSSLLPCPDGDTVFCLASSLVAPPQPARLDARAADQTATLLPCPGAPSTVPGRLEEVTTTAADGTPLRAALILPPDEGNGGPVPLVVWMHGGPLSSWNDWSWRWNPHLMAARGWAVLLPDPALSTGYGDNMLRRGWGQWGGAPYDDIMALTDAALQRPDLDAERTAAMGGSYGGYLANWVAGHTDRFRALVSHASVWALDHFQATTDLPGFWEAEFGTPETNPEFYENWSPHRFAANITTPMLVIHGARDFRCPLDQGLRLWWELVRRQATAKFLYFPDENHWILSPAGAAAWYGTVFAFLDHHVLGKPWERPALV